MARGDILLVALPDSDKREERGTRPAIAVQTDNADSSMLMIIPVTSSLGALRFPLTIKIDPSPQQRSNPRICCYGISTTGDRS